ncbi:kinase-like domain-containing protein [Hypoxylon cercidicola]|nr:kinase-like domain-containing protein [Hypoxylon cercidicola]
MNLAGKFSFLACAAIIPYVWFRFQHRRNLQTKTIHDIQQESHACKSSQQDEEAAEQIHRPTLETPANIDFIRNSYTEEDTCCSIRLVLRNGPSRWHIKVTFKGSLPFSKTGIKRTQRRKDFESLCHSICFHRIDLLQDTVTEIVVSDHSVKHDHDVNLLPRTACPNNRYSGVEFGQLYSQEDPLRVHFPSYTHSETPVRDFADVKKEQDLAAGISTVHVIGDKQLYVLKEIDRPLYIPRDTEVFQHELQNLEALRGTEGIVQLKGLVISRNPYQTLTESNTSCMVLRGALLEYHPHGTLRDALASSEPRPWLQWALRLASGLNQLHSRKITHMDLKPENIVIDASYEVVLIDLSGRAVTYEWLSPEMRDICSPWELDLVSRIKQDTWAFGTILQRMADVSTDDMEKKLLNHVGTRAAAESPSSRLSFFFVISELQPFI